VLSVVGGAMLMIPVEMGALAIYVNVVGLAIAAAVLAIEYLARKAPLSPRAAAAQ
jgi:hypothetical protein